MLTFDSNKKKRIAEILAVVKLSSLLFCGIVFVRNLFGWGSTMNINGVDYEIPVIGTIFVFLLSSVYLVWYSFTAKKFNFQYTKVVKILETFIFIIIFLITILLSGAEQSTYKHIFIFIITTSTIQWGLKFGTFVACLSSAIILAIDLICAPNLLVNMHFENDLLLSGIFILTAWPLGFYVKIENEHIAKLESLVHEDGLTGVYNHRFFHEKLKEEIELCENKKQKLSLIFLDIDYFKHYNDLYGHQSGDEVLRSIGLLLKDNIRTQDIVARYGGEEFAIILRGTGEEEAVFIAENIRRLVADTYFEGEENQPNGKLTISIGVSTFPEKAKDAVELIKSADDALYRAKFFKKNKVVTYTSVLDELKKDIAEKDIELVTSFKTLISIINAKDRYTYGHVERVVMYCRLLSKRLGLSAEDKKKLKYGAYMHDIGKIDIPKDILNKKMPLNKEEWESLKQHPANGVEIIGSVEFLKDIKPLILYHHERFDGKGYPCGLSGNNIPYLARLLTIADSFDAMTSNRPYNKRKSYEEAIEELRKCSGTQFDPDIAEAFIEVIEENKQKFDSLVLAGEE